MNYKSEVGMKILLVGGFLGSGKTSFILQLAHYMVEKMGIANIAVLENEIGELSIDDKLIKGCQSRVWLDYRIEDGKIIFNADSDAIITKGIISLLIGLYSGRTPQEILSSDFSVVEKIGLRENLSPTRANGLVSMIAKIKEIAGANV